MSSSYLDATWLEAQASELAGLREKLQTNLDVIALAAGQLPDLVAQVQRLEQREQETHSALEALRDQSINALQSAAHTGTTLLAERAQALQAELSRQAEKQQHDATRIAEELRLGLTSHQAELQEQFHREVQEALDSIPASMKAVETLGIAVRSDVQQHLERLSSQTDTRERLLLDTLSSLEADLKAQYAAVDEDFKARMQASLDSVSASLQAISAVESDLRSEAKVHQNSVSRLLEERQRETKGTLQASEVRQQEKLTALEHRLETQSQEWVLLLNTVDENTRNQGAEIAARFDEYDRATQRLGSNQQDTVAQLHDLRQYGESTEKLLQDVQLQVEKLRSKTEVTESSIQKNLHTLKEALTVQARQQEEKQLRLQRTLDEHARLVRQSLDDVENKQRDLETRLRKETQDVVKELRDTLQSEHSRMREQLQTAEEENQTQHASLTSSIGGLRRDANDIKSEIVKVNGRLTGFLRWFSRAGAWARLNSKPEQ